MPGDRTRAGRRWSSVCLLATALLVVTLVGAARWTDTAQGTQTPPKTGVKAPATTTSPTTAGPTTASPTSSTAASTTAAPATTSTSTTVATVPVAAAPASGVLAEPPITTLLGARRGSVTAAVYDYVTGQISLYRPGMAVATASIVKVDILETLLNQVQAQRRALTSDEQRDATQMIDQSDNDDATELWNEVGGSRGLTAFNAAAGLGATVPDAAGYWGLTTTTAADQVQLLRNLTDPSTTLVPANQAFALGLMAQVEPSQAWGITAGLQPGTAVSLKNGWLPESDGWYVNSIGVVSGDGRHYALAVLTAGDADQQYGEDTIGDLSALLWTALAH